MKIVFFGTPEFAATILQSLKDAGHDIVAVVTRPDRKKGRGLQLQESEVKKMAGSLELLAPLLQPEKVSAKEVREVLETFHADIFVVAAFGEIVSEKVLAIPPLGCINVHGSLLPLYRGAAPIQRAVMEGREETGITIMHMVRKMDAGDMIAKRSIPISCDMTYGDLASQLALVGSELLLTALNDIESGQAPRISQDEAMATYAPKIEWEECRLDWNRSAKELHDLVRGVNPEPGAWTVVYPKGNAKTVKIWKTRVVPCEVSGNPPGEVHAEEKKRLIVSTGDGALEILELQVEGKKRLPAEEVLKGMPARDWIFSLPFENSSGAA